MLLLHGFAMTPTVYEATAALLAERAHVSVVMPWLFALPGTWSADRAFDGLSALVDELDGDQVSIIGHSFSGGLELGLASQHPERVAELVFADTLGVSREWHLAGEFFRHPVGILRMATLPAAAAFAWSVSRHPDQLARAGWWGFIRDGRPAAAAVRGAGIPCHVLWADRDTLLSRSDGEDFARDLGATFTLAQSSGAEVADHDWVFRHPGLFVDRLEGLGLSMFKTGRKADRISAR